MSIRAYIVTIVNYFIYLLAVSPENSFDWLNVLGQLGQFFGAIFQLLAAIIAIFAVNEAKKQVKEAREQTTLNRQLSAFSWQPLIEVTFSFEETLGAKPSSVLVLPFQDRAKVNQLPSKAKILLEDFIKWDKDYKYPANSNLTAPHTKANYLILDVYNRQQNAGGQAFNITILIDLHYADPDKHRAIDFNNSPVAHLAKKNIQIPFKLERLFPNQKARIWLADVTNQPGLEISVLGIKCTTWNGEYINWGTGSKIELFDSNSDISLSSFPLEKRNIAQNNEPLVSLYPIEDNV